MLRFCLEKGQNEILTASQDVPFMQRKGIQSKSADFAERLEHREHKGVRDEAMQLTCL